MNKRRYGSLYRIHLWLTLATLAAFACPAISPQAFWPAALFSLSIPFFLLLQFVFLFGWLILRRYYFLIAAASIAAGWGPLQRTAGFGAPAAASAEEMTLDILTYNVRGLRHVKNNSNIRLEDFVQMIEAHHCDLLLLQEFPQSANRLGHLSHLLRTRTNLKYHYSDRDGTLAAFSAFPVIEGDTRFFPNRTNGYQRIDLKVGDQTLRVFNVHLQSNTVTGMTERVASDGNLKEKQTWLDIRGILRRFIRAARQRAMQAEELALQVSESPLPVILCGDLNDTPHSYTYRRIAAPFRDSFAAKGRGLGATYAGHIPGLRIDYIFADRSLRVLKHRVEKQGFSDHKAVRATVALHKVH